MFKASNILRLKMPHLQNVSNTKHLSYKTSRASKHPKLLCKTNIYHLIIPTYSRCVGNLLKIEYPLSNCTRKKNSLRVCEKSTNCWCADTERDTKILKDIPHTGNKYLLPSTYLGKYCYHCLSVILGFSDRNTQHLFCWQRTAIIVWV